MDTSTTTSESVPAQTDDEILAAFAEESAARAATAAAEIKAADVAAVKKLTELRAANPGIDLIIVGDSSGGAFRGVFRTPSPEIWKDFQTQARSDTQRPHAGRNLTMTCLLWPGRHDLEAAATRRPALFNVLSGALAVEAGSGVDAVVKR